MRSVPHGVVRAAVAEGELEGLVPEGEPEQLVAEADTEERHAAEQRRASSRSGRSSTAGSPGPFAISTARGSASRIASASHDARHDVGLEAGVGEPARDRALRAEVDDDDARAGADRVRPRSRRPGGRAAGRRSAARRAPARAAPRPAPRRARSGATPPSRILRTSVRVSTSGQRDDARGRAARPRTPGGTSRMTTPSHCTRSDSSAGLVDAVVADQRIAEAEHLGDVARIGHRLLVAGHRGREARLAGGHARRRRPRCPGRRCRPRARVLARAAALHRFASLCIIRICATAAILGAAGYTGQETLDRLLAPPRARADRARLRLARRPAGARRSTRA